MEMRKLIDVMEAGFNPEKHSMNDQHIDDLVENALNAACHSVQETLGITDGGPAGVFFTGKNEQVFRDLFKEYIKFELRNLQ